MYVNKDEKMILKLIEKGVQSSRDMEIEMSTVRKNQAIYTLANKGLIRRIARGTYERTELECDFGSKNNRSDRLETPLKPIDTTITEEQKAELIKHYRVIPRTQLAKKLGLGKLEMNQIIIEQGLRA